MGPMKPVVSQEWVPLLEPTQKQIGFPTTEHILAQHSITESRHCPTTGSNSPPLCNYISSRELETNSWRSVRTSAMSVYQSHWHVLHYANSYLSWHCTWHPDGAWRTACSAYRPAQLQRRSSCRAVTAMTECGSRSATTPYVGLPKQTY